MFKRLVKSLAGSQSAAVRPAAAHGGSLVERGAQAQRAGERALARTLYQQALAADAKDTDALHLLGVLEYQEKNYDQAVELIEQAIALQPEVADFHMNCSLAYLARGELEQAIARSREALRLRPDFRKAHANLLFALLFSDAEPSEILEEHRRWYRAHLLPGRVHLAAPANTREPERRLRVGYVSADFREHVVARFVEPLFVHHDPAAVELFAYDGGNAAGAVNARLRDHVANWRLIEGLDDAEVSRHIRADGIDILVDLAGHTLGGRLGVFAAKPAPLQVSYLGYPGTTGVPEIDYRVTDAHCDPPGMTESHYVERLLRLPDCLVCYLPPAEIAPATALPASAGGGVTFGSFNQPAKLAAGVLDLWARVLLVVPGSQLMMAQIPEGYARERYLREFAARGITAGRIRFEPRMPLLEYQALRGRVDIALDSFPMNGGSTTCETLWMGVPLVTVAGDRYVSRVGSSMLATVGLDQCIAQNADQYVAIAAGLAADLPRLARMRAALREQMRASPLMDGARFTRNLEVLYRQIWRDWCGKQVPGS